MDLQIQSKYKNSAGKVQLQGQIYCLETCLTQIAVNKYIVKMDKSQVAEYRSGLLWTFRSNPNFLGEGISSQDGDASVTKAKHSLCAKRAFQDRA